MGETNLKSLGLNGSNNPSLLWTKTILSEETGMEAETGVHKNLSHAWWLDSHTSSRRSPWLRTTLADLEEKTKGMLKLIDEDADSFAKRAEMYYKKRPELVNMIEELYRAHRSLADRYDQLKLEGRLSRTTSFDSSFSNTSQLPKLQIAVDKLSEPSLDSSDSGESEVDDPEPEVQVESSLRELPSKVKLFSEVERLEKENATLMAELAVKDEEKREVIRQLSLSVDIIKEENHAMRKCIKDSKKWGGGFLEFKKLKMGFFSGKLFGGFSKSQTTVVAL